MYYNYLFILHVLLILNDVINAVLYESLTHKFTLNNSYYDVILWLQIVLLMDVLRNSIAVENSRIPCVHSLFLCRCLEIFLSPGKFSI